MGSNIENLQFTKNIVGNVRGNALDNEISGTGHKNALTGMAGDDTLFGLDGNDNLNGGDGDDVLNGGRGMDKLSGGAGNDVFVFGFGDSSVGKTRDVITDFHSHLLNDKAGGDALDLSDFDAQPSLLERQSITFIGSNAFHENGQGEVRFQNGIVYGDSDGDGIADFEIALKGVAALTDADFIW